MKTRGSELGWVLLFLIVFSALIMGGNSPVSAEDNGEAQGIVDKARVTFNDFMRDKDYSWLHRNLKFAEGVLIYPQILKGGFIIGGSGGTGVLLVREETGDWSQPAFYTVGTLSFGLQIGGEAAETIILLMTQNAVDSLYTSAVKLGGDTSVALGPVGTGAKTDVTADFIAFSKSKGAYAGVNLEGSVVKVRDSLNRAYYGRAVTPVQIIVEKKVSRKGSAELRAALKRAAK